jgi:hypothetical protein
LLRLSCLKIAVCACTVLLEFRARENRDPDSKRAESDSAKLRDMCSDVLKSVGVPGDYLNDDFST